jgi:hypothetical protein
MPLLSTLGNAGSKAYGGIGIQPGGSALFSGGNRALSVAPSSNFAYGTGNFTVEAWIRPSDFNTWRILFAQTGVWNSRAYWYFLLYLDRFTGQLAFQMNPFVIVHPTALALNVWSHVAVVRNSGQLRLYVNGNGGSTISATSNLLDQSVRPTLGNYSRVADQGSQGFQGYITNLRVAKSAIYTSNFIPSRTPFTRSSQGATNVQLLLNHQTSSRFLIDSSANNLTVSNTGAVPFNALSPYTEPYVVPPVVVIVSATVTPSATTVSEGSTVTFTVAGTNTANGTYYYTIEETSGGEGTLTGADFSTGLLSGSFTITGNSGTIPLTVVRDLATEGDESFSVFVRSGSISGPILGVSPIIDITDSSLTPAFTSFSPAISEGIGGGYAVENVGPDGTYFWTILHNTTVAADFIANSGSFTVAGSTGGLDNGFSQTDASGISIIPSEDRTTEGSETFRLQIRSGSTSGPVILTSDLITVTDRSLTPAFTSTPASINEGSSGTFTVNNLGSAGTYYWTILNGTTANSDFSSVSGSFTTSTLNGSGSFSVTPIIDYITEGVESFQVQIRTGSTSGTVILTSAFVTINDTSTLVSASASPTSFDEGNSTTITASATAFPNGTYYWTILNGTTTNADFSATSGSFTVSNGTSGSFTVSAVAFDGAEGAETFSVQIRTGSTSGTVIATTGAITINVNTS